MRILHITAGSGSFHCGVTLRDHALVQELRRKGHEVWLQPVYLPLILDSEEPSLLPVTPGGISLYMEQKIPLARKLPSRFLDWMDAPCLLRLASHCQGMTQAKDLGMMALGAFQTVDGPQKRRWEELIFSFQKLSPPDVISISPGLLSGLAAPLRGTFPKAQIFAHLQGEDVFLDSLPEPFRADAWQAMAKMDQALDGWIAPSRFYGEVMRERLSLAQEKVTILTNGIDLDVYRPAPAVPESPPTIGFLARQIHGKGLHLLISAFLELRAAGRLPHVRLRIAGSATAADRLFIRQQKSRIREAGLAENVEFLPNLSLAEKVRFLQSLTVFSVPTVYEESFGQYLVEALACGVPCVQPDHGAFPELLHSEVGGLCRPDDPSSLAEVLEATIQRGIPRSTVRRWAEDRFNLPAMADGFLKLCD